MGDVEKEKLHHGERAKGWRELRNSPYDKLTLSQPLRALDKFSPK